MMKIKYGILVISIFLLIVSASCTRVEEDQPTKTETKVDFPDQESWHSTITITRNGKRVAEVWAGYIAVYNSKKIALLKDSIHVDFFDKDGTHNSVLTADSGLVHNDTNNLEAEGNVKVVSDSGVVLQTARLNWDNKKQKIISEVPLRFTTREDTLIGDSFISDPDLKNYEIRNARGYSQRRIPVKRQPN